MNLNKKLFDDGIDSGISESSVTSEVLREKLEPGTSLHEKVKIKQERESSIESSRRKRKNSTDSDASSSLVAPAKKKIKAEPNSSEDELDYIFEKLDNVKDAKESEKTSVKSNKKKDKLSEKSTLKSIRTTLTFEPASPVKVSSTKEKKSKKKKKQLGLEDDFETSLQLLLDSSIKKEK